MSEIRTGTLPASGASLYYTVTVDQFLLHFHRALL